MTNKKNTPVGTKGYTGNKNGRPADKLKKLTPAELKKALNDLKRVTPKAVEILVAYMEATSGVEQAKAAKEILNLYMALDRHAVSRAEQVSKLTSALNKQGGEELDGAESAFNEEKDQPAAPVLTLRFNAKDED